MIVKAFKNGEDIKSYEVNSATIKPPVSHKKTSSITQKPLGNTSPRPAPAQIEEHGDKETHKNQAEKSVAAVKVESKMHGFPSV